MELQAAKLSKLGQVLRLARLGLPRQGLLKIEGLAQFLREFLKPHETFETLSIPLSLAAVDLRSAKLVTLDSGNLLAALKATIALPGVFEPVRMGAQLLVDGGVLENLPVSLARKMGAGVIVAVDVTSDPRDEVSWQRSRMPAISQHLWRSFSIMITQQTEWVAREIKPEILLHPPIPAAITTISGFRHVPEIIRAGERAMREALPRLRELLAVSEPEGIAAQMEVRP